MVRFKNRYIIVEFLHPGALTPAFPAPTKQASSSRLNTGESTRNIGQRSDREGDVAADDDDEDEEEDDYFSPIPTIPFLLPLPPDLNEIAKRDDSGKEIYKAVKNCVQDVFGDEGWGRIGSSFKVIYHSPLTTLTILRIARPHIRTLLAGVTLVTAISPNISDPDKPVTPRVVGISGTIKKAQGRIGAYHRAVVAGLMAAIESGAVIPPVQASSRPNQIKRQSDPEQDRKILQNTADKEQQAINNLKE